MKPVVYLDNAATTSIDPLVLEAMIPYLSTVYGNPSSSYSIGRQAKMAIEGARKQVAELLGVKPLNIYFTSGGTESNNTAIAAAVQDLGCKHIITSPIEHHAVLHTVEHYCRQHLITYSFVKLTADGQADLHDLEMQLAEKTAEGTKCLVSLMHANNEIGALLPIEAAGKICRDHQAIFHSDCVQTIGHYPLDLIACGMHFASASGHKFNGPKGTGILYVSDGVQFTSLIHGGGQERKKRAGTENVHGMIGFAKALELAMLNNETEQAHVKSLNHYMREQLSAISSEITFNSRPDGLYTVLSTNFPTGTNTDLMLAIFDREGICASGGSACSSGESAGSHVIAALNKGLEGATIRFSFSKSTTIADLDFTLGVVQTMLEKTKPALAN